MSGWRLGPKVRSDDLVRCMSYVDRSGGPDACHPWTASVNVRYGYGQFSIRGKMVKPHRWLMEQHLGRQLFPHEHVLHSCDNPPCCNLNHLSVGSHQENMDQMSERGRRKSPPRQTICARGHAMTVDNIYVAKNGDRSCRACRNLRQREYSRKKKNERIDGAHQL